MTDAQAISGIALQISLLLFSSLVGFFIAARFKQPSILGGLFIGTLIGPSFLGIVSYSETIQTVALIGAIFLLFTVGLGMKATDLTDTKAIVVATTGQAIPIGAGVLVSRALGLDWIASTFMGIAIASTGTAITVKVFSDLGKLDRKEAKVFLGATVFDDILALLALSISQQVAFAGSISILSLFGRLVFAVIFLVSAYVFGKRFISDRLISLHNWAMLNREYEHAPMIAAVFVAFSYGVLAELFGLSSLVGAFIAGLSINKVEEGGHKEGARYLEMIFGSLFFVSLGVLVDLKSVFSLHGLFLFLVVFAVSVSTKFLAGFFSSRLFRLGMKESAVIGAGMIPLGEISLLVGLIGVSSGILSKEPFSAIIAVTFATSILAPIAIKSLYSVRTFKKNVKIY